MKSHDIDLNKVPGFASILRNTADSVSAIYSRTDMTDADKELEIANILNKAF